jgi:hypothetical protein
MPIMIAAPITTMHATICAAVSAADACLSHVTQTLCSSRTSRGRQMTRVACMCVAAAAPAPAAHTLFMLWQSSRIVLFFAFVSSDHVTSPCSSACTTCASPSFSSCEYPVPLTPPPKTICTNFLFQPPTPFPCAFCPDMKSRAKTSASVFITCPLSTTSTSTLKSGRNASAFSSAPPMKFINVYCRLSCFRAMFCAIFALTSSAQMGKLQIQSFR